MADTPARFRADLEGLRGIAILLVVLFHARVAALGGGFVGVDVFFVLSGYFITALLAREADRTGEIDVGAFWARRATRIVPALVLMLAATLAAAMWLYAPIDRADIARTVRSAALSGANIEFARSAVNYFSSGESPLLHTWSLGVEEQFYGVWPLLLLVAVMLHDGTRRTANLLRWIAVAGTLSFVASLWITTAAPSWAFFGMPARLWEFALGGALALVMSARAARPVAMPGATMQVAGLIVVAIGVVTYDRATPYLGVAALLPVLGTVALIAGGELAVDNLPSRLLSAAPLRWLGRVSYAWYLWHWPLVSLAVMLHPALGTAGRVAWSLAALVPAWLTWRTVESSARDGRMSRMSVRAAALSTVCASVCIALAAHVAVRAASRDAARPAQRTYAAARGDRLAQSCFVMTVDEVRGPCLRGTPHGRVTIALLGDSHAEHWIAGLDAAGRARGWTIDAMVKGGCPVAEVPLSQWRRPAAYQVQCLRYRAAMLARIIAARPDVVILSSWDHYQPLDEAGDAERWSRELRRTYARLTAAGIRVIVMRDTPQIPFDAPACLSRRDAGLPVAMPCRYARAAALSPGGVAAQNRAAAGLAVRFVDMNDQVCGAPVCEVAHGRMVVFTDDNHLTATFSRSLAPVLGERIAAAMR